MKKCKFYDPDNLFDMEKLEKNYSPEHLQRIKAKLEKLVEKEAEKEKEKHEFQSGDCCPICGSINYFQSGTCKTCHDCSFAGGCG